MTSDQDLYGEEEELRDTIRAYVEGMMGYFDYVQTLMMLGKSEDDVKDEVERIRAEIEAENAPEPKKKGSRKPKDAPKEEDPVQDADAEPVLKPGQKICGGCGEVIPADRDVNITINGKPACEKCFAEFTGLPVPEVVDVPPVSEESGEDGGTLEGDDGYDDDSEDYTADPADYEDDKEDYAAELIADGHMGVRADPEEDQGPEIEVEDYGMGVDPEEIEEEAPAESEDQEPGPAEGDESDDGTAEESPSESEEPPSEDGDDPEPPARDEGMEDFIESVYEDEPAQAEESSPRSNPATARGGIFAKLPKQPVRRRPKKSPDGDGAGGSEPKKKKEYDPESLMGRIDRWYKINFKNYVKLRTLSRNPDTGEFRMDLDLIKRKDLPRQAVAVTGEKHTYAMDRIRRTEWYWMNHDKSMVPPWEAQFTASDAALYMMSDKIDNALSINWTQQSSTLADNKKIILIAALGILGIVLFFMMRHRYYEILQGTRGWNGTQGGQGPDRPLSGHALRRDDRQGPLEMDGQMDADMRGGHPGRDRLLQPIRPPGMDPMRHEDPVQAHGREPGIRIQEHG